jgi:hypothetical protein
MFGQGNGSSVLVIMKGIKILSLFHFSSKNTTIFRRKNGFQEENYYLIHAFAANATSVSGMTITKMHKF